MYCNPLLGIIQYKNKQSITAKHKSLINESLICYSLGNAMILLASIKYDLLTSSNQTPTNSESSEPFPNDICLNPIFQSPLKARIKAYWITWYKTGCFLPLILIENVRIFLWINHKKTSKLKTCREGDFKTLLNNSINYMVYIIKHRTKYFLEGSALCSHLL